MIASVYVIQSDAGPVKIGVSRQPTARLKTVMQYQPFDAKVVHSICDEEICAFAIERAAHALLSAYRQRGEWFNVSPEQAIEAIAQAIEQIKNPIIEEPEEVEYTERNLKTHRLQMVISPEEVEQIDRWRREQDDLPSRSEAIRRLVQDALATARQRQKETAK